MTKKMVILILLLVVSLFSDTTNKETQLISINTGKIEVIGVENAAKILSTSINKFQNTFETIMREDKFTKKDQEKVIQTFEKINLAVEEFQITLKKMEKPTQEMMQNSIDSFFEKIPLQMLFAILKTLAIILILIILIVFLLNKFIIKYTPIKDLTNSINTLSKKIEKL